MDTVTWIMIAGMIVWTGIGLCIFQLGRRQSALAKRLLYLENLKKEEE